MMHAVGPESIDHNGHVNNLEYLRWGHRISGLHWEAAVPDDLRAAYRWVVARNEMDYFREVFEGDRLRLETWIEKAEKATTVRVVEIYNETRGELAARGRIFWYALDAGSGKPRRIGTELIAYFI
jgi:acyl-CoA thioester hydrolase